MDKSFIDTPLIDTNLASYEKFFDHEWCERTFEAAKDSALEDAVAALMVAWRSANGAHVLPWLIVKSLKGYAQGEIEGQLQYRATYSEEVIKGIVEKLDGMMQSSLSRNQRRSLNRAVTKIEKESHQALKSARAAVQFDVDRYWNYLVHAPEFQFCILGTQRINYGLLFFPYEDFLANAIRTKKPTYSSKKERISTAFAKTFGDPLTTFCWNNEEVELARLVRNALAHNGGRFGKDLEKYRTRFTDATGTTTPILHGDQFNLVDGRIQINPDNTAYLFNVLKERVSKIVEQVR